MLRFLSVTVWAYGVWIVLTWTRTAEQLCVGLVIALLVSAALSPLGRVAAPWSVLRPRRLLAVLMLGCTALVRVVVANGRLTRRIWLPSRPLRSGMIIVETSARTDGELAAVGLISSLIVDNQLVDLDRDAHRLQYHALDVPPRGERAAARINGPVERFLPALTGRRS
jgi:multicomponent Na+:H+ antiporter subunit E